MRWGPRLQSVPVVLYIRGVKIIKCIMNPRPDIQEELIKPYKEMEDVYSLSCVVGDAMEREQVMRHDMKPKSINKKIIGPAITVKLTAGDIVDCLCVFEIARPGDVIVIDAFGETETSIWGTYVWPCKKSRYSRCCD